MAVYVPRKVQMRKATTIKGGHTISRHSELSPLQSYQSDEMHLFSHVFRHVSSHRRFHVVLLELDMLSERK